MLLVVCLHMHCTMVNFFNQWGFETCENPLCVELVYSLKLMWMQMKWWVLLTPCRTSNININYYGYFSELTKSITKLKPSVSACTSPWTLEGLWSGLLMGISSGLLVRAKEYLEGPEGVSRCDRNSIQLRSHYHSVHRAKDYHWSDCSGFSQLQQYCHIT